MTGIYDRMQAMLPEFVAGSRLVCAVQHSEAVELEALDASLRDVLKQFYLGTATWGLSHWERLVGVPTELGKPLDQRRAYVKSKLRGSGTVTVDLIRNVAESYVNGDVSVGEDFAGYTIQVTFISQRGIPSNLDDIQQALRDIIPAHLSVTFQFSYLVWDELDAHHFTWDQIDALNKTWDQWEVYR